MNEGPTSYRASGVDLGLGDDASRIMFEASRETWSNRRGLTGAVECPVDSFGGLRFLSSPSQPQTVLGMNFDGVGTKFEVAELGSL